MQRIIRTYQLPSRRQRLLAAGLIPLTQMAQLLGVSTGTVKIWYHAGIVSGQRYNDKGEVLYHPPGPNPHGRRPNRSLQLHPPRPDHPVADLSQQRIKRCPVLGGLINEYERAA